MGYRLTKMADFQNALKSRLFGVFARGFLHRATLLSLQNHFQHVFCEKKKLKITCSFCMGYRLTKMIDFQYGLISLLVGVFARGFLHRTTLLFLQNHFEHLFAKKKVENKLPILHGLQTYQNGRFSKWSHSSNVWNFCTRFFAQNNSIVHVESFSACFWEKKCKLGYKLTKTVDFQNGLISQIFGVSASGFLYRRTLLFLRQSTIIALECRNVTNKAFWKNASFPPLLPLLHFDPTKNGNVSPVTLRGERGFVQVPSTEGQRTPWTSLN